ncbi:MAG TPA: hypothetical protein VKS01_02410 [Bryobacteraceae bacterium]|nr:hypothetical protein [Bryobacteraceae bacterium]
MIAGHNTDVLRPYYPDASYLSLVRDPVERSISMYLHYKHHPDSWERTGKKIHENNIGLGEFMDANWFHKAHNLQTRLLLGERFMTKEPREESAMLAAIRARFYLIGYTEAHEKFLFYLHLTCAFPLVLFNKRLVRRERTDFHPSQSDLEAVERQNRLDRALYRCARQEFDRRTAEVWTPAVDDLYRRYMAAIDEYRRSTKENPDATPLVWSPAETALVASPGRW